MGGGSGWAKLRFEGEGRVGEGRRMYVMVDGESWVSGDI